jgi:hypothetical protein
MKKIKIVECAEVEDEKKYVKTLFGGYLQRVYKLYGRVHSQSIRFSLEFPHVGRPVAYKLSMRHYKMEVELKDPYFMVNPRAIIHNDPCVTFKKTNIESDTEPFMRTHFFSFTNTEWLHKSIQEIHFSDLIVKRVMFVLEIDKHLVDIEEKGLYGMFFRFWVVDVKSHVRCHKAKDINFYFK